MTGPVRTRGETGAGDPPARPGSRLLSWKAIAQHLGVSVRTVQRWERVEGLPTHRHMHAVLGSVYAELAELDAWWAGRPGIGARSSSRGELRRSVAVLPFTNLSRDLETDILADGLTEEVITTLSHVPGLNVIARTSAFRFKGARSNSREIGSALGVGTILKGSVRRADGRVRVVARLIDAATGTHLWALPFDTRRTDVFGIQEDVAHAIAGTLRAAFSGDPRPPAPAAGAVRANAFEWYLEGRYYWNRRTPAGWLRAVDCFERALSEDSRLAVAWAALSSCYSNECASAVAPADAPERALRAAQNALALDPDLADAHVSVAAHRALHEFDWIAAESHFLRAIAIAPHNAAAHMLFAGLVLAPTGRVAEARTHQAAAIRQDPLSPLVLNADGMLALVSHEYAQAGRSFRRALDLDPEYPWACRGLGEVLMLEGRGREAIAWLERVESPNLALGFLGYCHATLGAKEEAIRCLQRLQHRAESSLAYQEAAAHLGLGDVDSAFSCLGRACAARSVGVIWLPVDPIWDPLRSDPRFEPLLATMHVSIR